MRIVTLLIILTILSLVISKPSEGKRWKRNDAALTARKSATKENAAVTEGEAPTTNENSSEGQETDATSDPATKITQWVKNLKKNMDTKIEKLKKESHEQNGNSGSSSSSVVSRDALRKPVDRLKLRTSSSSTDSVVKEKLVEPDETDPYDYDWIDPNGLLGPWFQIAAVGWSQNLVSCKMTFITYNGYNQFYTDTMSYYGQYWEPVETREQFYVNYDWNGVQYMIIGRGFYYNDQNPRTEMILYLSDEYDLLVTGNPLTGEVWIWSRYPEIDSDDYAAIVDADFPWVYRSHELIPIYQGPDCDPHVAESPTFSAARADAIKAQASLTTESATP